MKNDRRTIRRPSQRRGLRGAGVVAALAGGLIVVAFGGMLGCARPLLSPADERSPFDRYDGIRAQYAQQTVEDEYGRQRPNLRERLSPRD